MTGIAKGVLRRFQRYQSVDKKFKFGGSICPMSEELVHQILLVRL